MKHADNNQVDLLLRSLAKTRGDMMPSESLSADKSSTTADHLDADELNCYAEGVVPAAARVRYTEHLADCERCRRIVIGLTQATGATAFYESTEQQRGAGLWQKLGGLLSPGVLRYAVPALALAGLIGISLFVLRQQSGRDFVAENTRPANTSTPSDQLNPSEPAAGNSAPARRTEIPKAPQSDTHPALNQAEQNTQSERNPAEVPGSDSGFGARGSLDSKSISQGTGEAQPKPANAPVTKEPEPPPPSTSTLSAEDKSAALAKDQTAKRDDRDERERGQYVFKSTPAEEHGPSRAAPRVAGAANSMRVGEPNGGRAASEANKKEKAREAETITTVAGRHFRHEGNTWIDTAYESSRGAINIHRGSEQYRALVADEPGLRSIADQLRGVVIVVWKNRVYRIQ